MEKDGPTIGEIISGSLELMRNMDQLEKMYPFKIRHMSIEVKAQYADEVCRNHVNSEWMKNQVKELLNKPYNLSEINTTSVGNLAYMALHSDDEETRYNARKLLDGFNEKVDHQQRVRFIRTMAYAFLITIVFIWIFT